MYNVIVISLIILIIKSSHLVLICPKVCVCDMIEGQRHADCSDQNLINAYIEVPNMVEVYDLSNNLITTLDKTSFHDLNNVTTLILKNNKINTIDYDTFMNLTNLKYLDLSKNYLESIDEHLLENNKKLLRINLSYNKFITLNANKPLLINKYVEILYLDNTLINYVSNITFAYLTNINIIDLSNNLLLTLNFNVFSELSNLKYINLINNHLKCDFNMIKLLRLFEKHKINVNMEKCTLKNVQMFEKLQLAPTEKPQQKDVYISDVWLITDENDELNNTNINGMNNNNNNNNNILYNNNDKSMLCDTNLTNILLCDLLVSCRDNYIYWYKQYNDLLDKTENNDYPVQRHLLYTRHNNIVFYIGIFCGFLFGSFCLFSVNFIFRGCKNYCCAEIENKRNKRNVRSRSTGPTNRQSENETFNDVNEIQLTQREETENCIQQTRHRPHTVRRRESRQIETNSNFATFVSGLFSRPINRQINRRTNLIRRLSRSNLFQSTLRLNGNNNSNNRRNHRTSNSHNNNNNNQASRLATRFDEQQQSIVVDNNTENERLINYDAAIITIPPTPTITTAPITSVHSNEELHSHATIADHSRHNSFDAIINNSPEGEQQQQHHQQQQLVDVIGEEHDTIIIEQRPETPPPPYNVCIIEKY